MGLSFRVPFSHDERGEIGKAGSPAMVGDQMFLRQIYLPNRLSVNR
jgi:hypothetical protein